MIPSHTVPAFSAHFIHHKWTNVLLESMEEKEFYVSFVTMCALSFFSFSFFLWRGGGSGGGRNTLTWKTRFSVLLEVNNPAINNCNSVDNIPNNNDHSSDSGNIVYSTIMI